MTNDDRETLERVIEYQIKKNNRITTDAIIKDYEKKGRTPPTKTAISRIAKKCGFKTGIIKTKYFKSTHAFEGNDDTTRLKKMALASASLIRKLLPAAKLINGEWCCGDISGNPSTKKNAPGSFKLNAANGQWGDFATSATGGDIFDLYMAQSGATLPEAKKWIADELGVAMAQIHEPRTKAPHKPSQWAKNAKLEYKELPPASTYGEPAKIFRYYDKDADGNIHCSYAVGRYEQEGHSKSILQGLIVDGKFKPQRIPKGIQKTLYNLYDGKFPPRENTVSNSQLVYIVEGEGKADLLIDAGLCATCNSGGTGGARGQFAPHLAGKDIVILPDNDEAGKKHAENVAKELKNIAKTIKIVMLPALPEKGDVANWLADGHDIEELRAIVNDAPFCAGKASVSDLKPEDSVAPAKGLERYSMARSGANSGLYCTITTKNGDEIDLWLCAPFEFVARTRDKSDGNWGINIRFRNRKGISSEYIIPGAHIGDPSPKNLLIGLEERGFKYNPKQKAPIYLRDYLCLYETDNYITALEKTGWDGDCEAHDDGYLMGKEYIPCTDAGRAEKVVWKAAPQQGDPYACGGTLDGWRNSIGRYCVKNSRLMMAVCASLAAPLLKVGGMENFGFNIWGLSSKGKTTLLSAAASVWGKGAVGGYLESWRATGNALENMAARHCDALFCLDEMGQIPGKVLGTAVYDIMNGSGKARNFRDGRPMPIRTWRTLLISTGEITLQDKIAEDQKSASHGGQRVRIADIQMDAGAKMGAWNVLYDGLNPAEFANALKVAASTHYGHASREMIKYISENRQHVMDMIAEIDINEICPENADEQVERVAAHFMLCLIAGKLMRDILFIWPEEWQPAHKDLCIEKAVQDCFESFLEGRGGTGSHEEGALIAKVRLFLENHGTDRFAEIGAMEGIVRDRCGYYRKNNDATVDYFCLPESFKSVLCAGYNLHLACKILADAGILLRKAKQYQKNIPQAADPDDAGKGCYQLRIKNYSDTI